MDASEIKDEKSLQAWLETRPQADSIAIAHRSALCPLMLVFRTGQYKPSRNYDVRTLSVLRCTQVSAIASKLPGSEIRAVAELANYYAADIPNQEAEAAYSAAQASLALSNYSQHAARSVVFGINATIQVASGIKYAKTGNVQNVSEFIGTVQSEAWLFVQSDAAALINGNDLFTLPLWHNGTPPDWFTTAEAAMRSYWQTNNPTHWAFWLRWWNAATRGRPLDWQLQHDIALIPDDIWQSGPGPVAEAIAEIEAEHRKAAATPLQTDNLPAPTDRPGKIKFVVKQVTLLHELIEEEYEYLRSHNGGSGDEQPLLDQQTATLQKLRELVNAMLAALEGDPSPSTALTVVNETLPVVVTEAETLTDQGAKPQVSAEIISMAATIKVLTESGAPGDLATKFAFANSSRNWFWSMFSKYRKGKS